jgi:RimJ/RimL family protein N-acetyltransferase
MISSADLLLTGSAIRLRPYRADDVDPLFEAIRESLPELVEWLPWCHPGYTRDDAATWVQTRAEQWNNRTEYSFVITGPSGERILGACGLNQFDMLRLRCNLGYWVRTSETGRGVGTQTAGLLARFGVEQLGLQRIEIVAAVDNRASQRVAEKAGAVREGIARNRLRVRGEMLDAVCYSIIPIDLARARS